MSNSAAGDIPVGVDRCFDGHHNSALMVTSARLLLLALLGAESLGTGLIRGPRVVVDFGAPTSGGAAFGAVFMSPDMCLRMLSTLPCSIPTRSRRVSIWNKGELGRLAGSA